MNITIEDILSIKHSAHIGFKSLSPARKINHVSTDSRSVKKGDLFIALRGENFDGHEFIQHVQEKGATAAIVDEKWKKKNRKKYKLPLIVVKNTLDAYGAIANLFRNKFSIPIILVAGSNGKTTMKEVISHVLGTSFNVLKTEANYNNQVGLPRMLLQLTPQHEFAVLEIGTNHPGEIEWLTQVAQPTHGIITNIGREHLEFFKNLRGVAKEELALFDYLASTEDGVAFINMDDPFLAGQGKRMLSDYRLYGRGTGASGRKMGYSSNGLMKIGIELDGKSFVVHSHLVSEYAPSLYAAVAKVASEFGLSIAKIKQALGSFVPYSKRMEILKIHGAVIINDCYNANPESFYSALETLKQIPSKGKKYVVAGDMFELGATSKREHRLLGVQMAKYKFNGHFFTGNAMKQTFAALLQTNTKLHAEYDSEKSAIGESLSQILKKGDIVLIKGSRGMKMETILEQLRTTN
ncbi:MAG: UDP-N-acetylmuramoyl-tripeptide--D-alanyl-D-alanine ligase [bacterium]